MVLGLIGAFGAAVCYGVASVLQALAARRTETAEGLDPRLFLRLLKSVPYVAGLALDCLGFGLSLLALRTLPLFLVQGVIASSLAVTAVLGSILLHMRLRGREKVAVGVVVAGLILLAASAAEDHPVHVSAADGWGTLIAAVALSGLAVLLARLQGRVGAAALGTVAGLQFGVVAVAARILPSTYAPGVLLTDPATYALIIAAPVGMLALSTALQRGTVTQATAPLVVAETVAPAAVGLLLFGDAPRAGWEWAAALGFVLAVVGAVSLASHGEVRVEPSPAPTPPAGPAATQTPPQ
ncbi:DMT family protein [Microlunatus ginsengisoli]|uniref:Integral membrane protein n=1 Tax=Microlunatus ginsengisoli TaxID=363863 RepID=A0ABP6ZW56_9ACTN